MENPFTLTFGQKPTEFISRTRPNWKDHSYI